jgi:hypothetical protein
MLREHIAPLLRENGFRRRANTWGRRTRDGWLVIEFQASQWSDRHELEFCIAVAVRSDLVARALGEPVQRDKVPLERLCHYRSFIAERRLVGKRKCWTIRADRSAGSIGLAARAALLKSALPHLESISSDERLLLHMERRNRWKRQPIRTSIVLTHRFRTADDFKSKCETFAQGNPAWMKEALSELRLPSRVRTAKTQTKRGH